MRGQGVYSLPCHEQQLGTDAAQRLDGDLPSDVMGTSQLCGPQRVEFQGSFQTSISSLCHPTLGSPIQVHACTLSLISIRFSSTLDSAHLSERSVTSSSASSPTTSLSSMPPLSDMIAISIRTVQLRRRQQYYQGAMVFVACFVVQVVEDRRDGCCARCAVPSLCRTAGSEPIATGLMLRSLAEASFSTQTSRLALSPVLVLRLDRYYSS